MQGTGNAARAALVATTLLWPGCAHPPASAPRWDRERGQEQVEELLEGRSAGVRVIRLPSGGVSVQIRGRGSIHGDTEPLYVVDGMPVQVTTGRGLLWLNPGDIERIEILKDAGATALYGVRGANGVVVITTHHGHRPPD